MNCSFIIEEIELSGSECTFYSIRFEGEKESEFMKFVYENNDRHQKDLGDILFNIKDMANRYGAIEKFFKIEEGSILDNLCVLPNKKSKLRLYCLRYSKVAVLLGGGGVKGKGAYQDYPELLKKVKILQEVCVLIDKRIKDGEIYWDNDKLSGNLEFKIEE